MSAEAILLQVDAATYRLKVTASNLIPGLPIASRLIGTGKLKSLELFPEHRNMARKILKMTGARTMSEARSIFLDPDSPAGRIDVILRNADSMTLLICELGRQLDAPPATPS